jgi:hypothetical protein
VGPGSWIGQPMPADFNSVPEIPGYIGLLPLLNPAPENAMYLQRLRQYEAARNMPLSSSISAYGKGSVSLLFDEGCTGMQTLI